MLLDKYYLSSLNIQGLKCKKNKVGLKCKKLKQKGQNT